MKKKFAIILFVLLSIWMLFLGWMYLAYYKDYSFSYSLLQDVNDPEEYYENRNDPKERYEGNLMHAKNMVNLYRLYIISHVAIYITIAIIFILLITYRCANDVNNQKKDNFKKIN